MTDTRSDAPGDTGRRRFLGSAAMTGGLLAGYGAFAAISGRYLYPAGPTPTRWLFVSDLGSFKEGESRIFRTPEGTPVAIARRGSVGTAEDFLALSSTCPHLGCQVHWQPAHSRFFCPCHNGVFDATGKATAGPPADAAQSLLRYPVKVENGLLFIEVPVGSLSRTHAPGVDRCFTARRGRRLV